MGCRLRRSPAGAAAKCLLRDPELAGIVAAVRGRCGIPVTVNNAAGLVRLSSAIRWAFALAWRNDLVPGLTLHAAAPGSRALRARPTGARSPGGEAGPAHSVIRQGCDVRSGRIACWRSPARMGDGGPGQPRCPWCRADRCALRRRRCRRSTATQRLQLAARLRPWWSRGRQGPADLPQNIPAGHARLCLARRSCAVQLRGREPGEALACSGRRVWKGWGGAELPLKPIPCRLRASPAIAAGRWIAAPQQHGHRRLGSHAGAGKRQRGDDLRPRP